MKEKAEMTKEELIALGWVKNPLDKMQEKTEKLTAVQWLKMKMATSPKEEMVENINVWFAKAEEMEKEQIVTAHYQGYRSVIGTTEVSEQYYNKTFKKNKMKTQEQREIKAENLVDDFVKEWRVENNTEDAVYDAYHYDAMIAFAEYFNELNKSE